MTDAVEQQCLSMIADAMVETVTSVPGIDMGVLGVALLPVPGRVLAATSLHVLPPVDGVSLLSGSCVDPSAPTAIGEAGLVRVQLKIPGIPLLSVLAYSEDVPASPRIYAFVMTQGADGVTVRTTCFGADEECLEFVESEGFARWALAAS